MYKKTVFIFGVSSFVGSNLAEYLKKDFRVIGSYHKHRVEIPGVLTVKCDVLSRDSIQMVMYTFKPDISIYAVGLTSLRDCAAHAKYADAINTAGVFNVTTNTERYKSRLIYISTAYIFSGEDKLFFENDTPVPNTMYGKTKASAEFFIQKSCLNYLIFRCSNFYGRSIHPRQNTWFEMLEKKIFKKEKTLWDSKIRLGLMDVNYLGEAIKKSIQSDLMNRLIQLSSKDIMSMYDFAKLYCQINNKDSNYISKGSWNFPTLDSVGTTHNIEGKYFYQLSVQNVENFLSMKVPTIEESLNKTKKLFGGKENSSTDSSKDNDSGKIQFI